MRVRFLDKIEEGESRFIIVFARLKGKIIFVKTSHSKRYSLIAGKIEKGETPFQAAEREIFEECQGEIKILNFHSYYSVESRGNKGYGALFIADLDSIKQGRNFEICHVLAQTTLPSNLRYERIQKSLYFKILYELKKRALIK